MYMHLHQPKVKNTSNNFGVPKDKCVSSRVLRIQNLVDDIFINKLSLVTNLIDNWLSPAVTVAETSTAFDKILINTRIAAIILVYFLGRMSAHLVKLFELSIYK